MKRLPGIVLTLLCLCMFSRAQDLQFEGRYTSMLKSAKLMENYQDYMYVMGPDISLRVYDAGDPTDLVQESVVALPAGNKRWQAEFHNEYLYLVMGSDRLWILNVEDPRCPEFAGELPLDPSEDSYIEVHDTLLYICDRDNGLRMFSLGDPSQPSLIEDNPFPLPQYYSGAVKADDSLLVLQHYHNYTQVLEIFDNSVPSSPDSLAGYYLPQSYRTERLHWVESTLWATFEFANQYYGYVIDFSDRENPALVEEFLLTNERLIQSDTLLYSFGGDGVRAFNVAEPTDPYELELAGSVGHWLRAGNVFGDHLLATRQQMGVETKDISQIHDLLIIDAGVQLFDQCYSRIQVHAGRLYGISHVPYDWEQSTVMGGIGTVIDLTSPDQPHIIYQHAQTTADYRQYPKPQVHDNALYVCTGTEPRIYDVGDPHIPELMNLMPGQSHGLVICGDHAVGADPVLSDHQLDLFLWDVSETEMPVLLDTISVEAGRGEGSTLSFTADEDAVYLRNVWYDSELNAHYENYVVEIQADTFGVVYPNLLSAYPESYTYAEIDGDCLLFESRTRVDFYNIEHRDAPVLEATLQRPRLTGFLSVTMKEGWVFVLDVRPMLRIYDHRDNTGPPQLHHAEPLLFTALEVSVEDDYVAVGNEGELMWFRFTGLTSDAPERDAELIALPSEMELSCYPNPFNASTTITCTLDRPGEVRVTVYDLLGREVRRLHDGRMQPGVHEIHWDGLASDGAALPSGMYFVRLQDGGRQRTSKAMLLR
ncbi:T9SS type A sorting domain-containing protein [bacterium]|nr:T9SS type A sorting domain-containing protein [bacterium]